MTDLTKFTDEELVALKEGDYSKLSDESLMALKQQDAPQIQEEQEVVEPVQEEVGEVEAFAAGAVQGIPKVIGAGAMALGQELMEDNDFSLQELKEKFDKEKDDLDAWVKSAEAQHPDAFTAGDITAGIAPALIPGVGAATAGLKASVVIGGASGLARADEAELTDALTGAGFGFLGHKVGSLLGEAVDPIAKKIGGYFSGQAGKKAGQITQRYGAKTVKETHDFVTQHYGAHKIGENGTKKTVKEALTEMGDTINKRISFAVGDTPEDLLHKTSVQKNILGKELDQIINQASKNSKFTTTGDTILSDAEMIIKNAMGGDDALQSQQNAAIAALKELDPALRGTLDDSGKIIPRELNLKDLNNLRQKVDSIVQSIDTSTADNVNKLKAKALKEFNKNLRNKVDDIVDDSLEDVAKGSFKELKREWATMNFMEKQVGTKVKKLSDSGLADVIKDTLTFGRVARTLGVSTLAGPQTAIAIGTIDALVSHPAFPQSNIAALQKLGNFIANNPEHVISKNISRAVTFGADTPEVLEQALNVGSAQATLVESPVERTTDSLIQNANAISILLRNSDPELAKQFNNAVRKNDVESLARIGDMLSKMPEASDYVQPGRGFDGRVFDPADIAQLESEVNVMDISLKQKLEHKKALREGGIIPVIQQEPERFFQVNKRDKNKPNY